MTQKTFSAALAQAPLRPFQIMVIALGLLLLVFDGIDLQSLSLVTPIILDEWGVDRATFGPALTATLLGMLPGSLLGGMLGDRIGRLKTLFAAAMIFGSGTIAAAYTHSVSEMFVVRALGGLGFGAAYPNALALVSDWVPERWKAHAVSILSVGIPMGISVSAALMPWLLPDHGWRGTFVIFGIASLVLGTGIVLLLREPPQFLLARGKVEAAQRNAARVIDPAIRLLPETAGDPAGGGKRGQGRGGVFDRRNLRLNVGMAISFPAITTLAYGLLNWTPELLTSAGFTLDEALRASFWQGTLSIVAGVFAGLVTRWLGSRQMILVLATVILANIVLLGWAVESLDGPPSAAQIALIVALEGCAVGLVSMMIAVFYVVMAHGYPPSCRSGGIGFVIASGRVLSFAMVAYGGVLISMGGESSFIWYFGTLALIALLVFAAAFIIDCHVEPQGKGEVQA
ncbi:MAG: MFS transporter [Erythrobacter sp.]|nr:MFS transporter [Erythrobacter sp.]